MDRGAFDALARLIAKKGSRRTVVATLFAASLPMWNAADALGASRNRRRRRRRNRNRNAVCFPGTNCTPGPGVNNSGCDFANSTAFKSLDAQGARLSNVNFSGADLTFADFRGSDLSGSCFSQASLFGAQIDASVNLDGAIFCGTMMPDGSINDQGCGAETACCSTCGAGGCLQGECVTINTICSIVPFATPCCFDLTCEASASVVVTRCQRLCRTHDDCKEFPPNLACMPSGERCPFSPTGKCCVPLGG